MYKPLVSVVIAAYCAEKTLRRAIESLKIQSYVNWEAIIVDDCSTDGTYELSMTMSRYDERLKVVRLEKNGGPAVARNAGIEASSGEWIAVLDADDVFLEGRLERLVSFALSNDYGLVVDNLSALVGGGELIPYWPKWQRNNKGVSLLEMIKGCSGALGRNYGLLKPLINKRELDSLGFLYDEGLRRGEDVEFCLRLMFNGVRAGRVVDIGYIYDSPCHDSKNNASTQNLEHSYIATLCIKNRFWSEMTLQQRLWLEIRLANTSASSEWSSFVSSKNKGAIEMLKLFIKHSSVRHRLLFGYLPTKLHSLFYKMGK